MFPNSAGFWNLNTARYARLSSKAESDGVQQGSPTSSSGAGASKSDFDTSKAALLGQAPVASGASQVSSSRAGPPPVRIERKDLQEFVAKIFVAFGASPENAKTTSKALAFSDAVGFSTHGLARLPHYVKAIQDGFILPDAVPELHETGAATGWVDAKNGFGQVAGVAAMKMAIKLAKQAGAAEVKVKNSNHFGSGGYYVKKALKENLVVTVKSNSAPLVVPTNGAEAVLGTNPVSFGAPASRHPDINVDMAISTAARGQIEKKARDGMEIPTGWAVDDHGRDTNDPRVVLKNFDERRGGGLLPLGGSSPATGGHKGYAMALKGDLDAGVMSGAKYAKDADPYVIGGQKRGPGQENDFSNLGHSISVQDPTRFGMSLDEFKGRVDDFIDQIKNSQKAEGKSEILIPGERGGAAYRNNEIEGIPIAMNVFQKVLNIAKEKGIEPPPLMPLAPAPQGESESAAQAKKPAVYN